MSFKKTALLICLAMVLFACSRTQPRIPFGFIELVYYSGDPLPYERFSFFVIAEDDDGIDNLGELRLYHDREGLEWIIKSEDWVHYEEEGRHWTGSRNIAMTEDRNMPRGQFRAVLLNKGGEKTERNFTFDAPEEPRYAFPVLHIEGGYFIIESAYPSHTFMVYDQQGNLLRTVPVPSMEGYVIELRLPNTARFLALWAQDETYQTSAMTDVVSLR